MRRPKTKEEMAAAYLKRRQPKSEETRARMSEAQKLFWAKAKQAAESLMKAQSA
jgi:hypothetical protein